MRKQISMKKCPTTREMNNFLFGEVCEQKGH